MKYTYETELDWCIDGGTHTSSVIVECDYSPQHRGGRFEPDWLDSVTILAVRVAKKTGCYRIDYKEILPALPDELIEHLKFRILDDIRANLADYEYDEQVERCIGA